MDQHARRGHLRTADNPETRLDYVVSMERTAGEVRVAVRYVPDRQILVQSSFAEYLGTLGADHHGRLEALASTLLHDLNNELVARWVQVSVTAPGHRVTIEDRQPKWDNPGLLSRLTTS